jgi:hypothetical protein
VGPPITPSFQPGGLYQPRGKFHAGHRGSLSIKTEKGSKFRLPEVAKNSEANFGEKRATQKKSSRNMYGFP